MVKFLIFITIFKVFFASAGVTFANNKSWEYKDWSVSGLNWGIKFAAQGTRVYGHEFGFIKKPQSCERDLLWISWSAYGVDIKSVVEDGGTVSLIIDDIAYHLEAPTGFAYPLTEAMTLFAFTGSVASENLVALLGKGKIVHVSIGSPAVLLNKLDITTDTFSLEGYIATRLKALEFCNQLNP